MQRAKNPTREEWLKLRHGGINSTETPALFGLSPYSTALEVAVLKQSTEVDDWEGNVRTRWGQRFQDPIAHGVAEDYGVVVQPVTDYIYDPKLRIGSSFDFEVIGVNDAQVEDNCLRVMFGKHGPGILEIKNVDYLIFRDHWPLVDGAREAPDHIELQLQHQLEVIGYQWGAIGVLVAGNSLYVLPRERFVDVGASIRKKVAEFWALLDAGELPPAVMPEDASVIIDMLQSADAGTSTDLSMDEEAVMLVSQYDDAREEEKDAKQRKEISKALLLQKIGMFEKARIGMASVSAGMIGPATISYERAGYRNFKLTIRKPKV